MSQKHLQKLKIEPLMVRNSHSVSLSKLAVEVFKGLFEFSVGLALTFAETSWIKFLLSEEAHSPDVLAYFTPQPVINEEEKVANFLIVIPLTRCWKATLAQGFWMVSGLLATDLELICDISDGLQGSKVQRKILQSAQIRGLLTTDFLLQQPHLHPTQASSLHKTLNKLLSVRKITAVPTDPYLYLCGILQSNMLTHRQLNGLTFLTFFGGLCEEIQQERMVDPDQLWQVAVEKSTRLAAHSVSLLLESHLKEMATTSEPLNMALELRIQLLVTISRALNVPLNSSFDLPTMSKLSSPEHSLTMFDSRYRGDSQLESLAPFNKLEVGLEQLQFSQPLGHNQRHSDQKSANGPAAMKSGCLLKKQPSYLPNCSEIDKAPRHPHGVMHPLQEQGQSSAESFPDDVSPPLTCDRLSTTIHKDIQTLPSLPTTSTILPSLSSPTAPPNNRSLLTCCCLLI